MTEAVKLQTIAKLQPETWGAFINGEFRPAASGKTFPTFDPGNGQVVGHLAECDEEDVDRGRAGAQIELVAGRDAARARSGRMRDAFRRP